LLNQIIAITLETVVNQALRLDPPSLDALSQLSGKIIRIELSGIPLNFTLFPSHQEIIILSDYDDEVDVCIKGAPFSLLRLLLQKEAMLSNNQEIMITGRISLAQILLQILQELEIDWEEQLAQRIGDMPAHQLGTLFRQCQKESHQQYEMMQQNLSEYWQEEARYLPAHPEMDMFLDAVDTLRNDVERLEQRVQRLIRIQSTMENGE
jgi:ubiquinone biosynthesis accessory factor UbiJ